jgi:biotin carboxyl carrier protein
MENKDEIKKLVIDDTEYPTQLTKKFVSRKRYEKADPKKVTAYIPGLILSINVKLGQKVRWGDSLLILEAMKMKNDVTAPVDGVVKEIHVETGKMVKKNELLITIE